MLEKIIRDFMTIWTTIDPISNLALLAGLTAAMRRSERRRIAWRASLYAAIVLVVAVIIVQILLDPTWPDPDETYKHVDLLQGVFGARLYPA